MARYDEGGLMGPLIVILGALGIAVVWNNSQKRRTEFGAPGTPFNTGQSVVLPNYGQGPLTNLQQKQVQQFQQLSLIAGSAATSAGALLGLAATAATGVGAVVAAAVIAIGLLRGTAHLVANQWTDPATGVQAKFNAALAAIVDAKDASLRDHTASKASVNYAKLAVNALYYTQYRAAAEQFALVDPDHRTVINNSYRTLDPIVGQIISDMNGQIASLPY